MFLRLFTTAREPLPSFVAFLGFLVPLMAISLLCLWLLVIGLGLIMLGVPPGAEEMARALIFLLVTIAYAGVWLAMLFVGGYVAFQRQEARA